MQGTGIDCEIVLSSRIRLARNLVDIPFPNRADARQLAEIVNRMRSSLDNLNHNDSQEYTFFDIEKLNPIDRYILVEKHLLSPMHVKNANERAAIIREDGAVSIMINEEDHLRIQCITPGLNLEGAFALADNVDDILEQSQDYAFTSDFGYLTACPTNLGTGLRASIMAHLPGLVYTKQMNRLVPAATQLGLAVRGLYGEGSEAAGNIFQISNQLTLGYTEQEIVANLSSMAKQVIEQERNARKMLIDGSKDAVEDLVWRAYGLLRYARSITSQEALSALSQVRLGIDMGIITDLDAAVFNELLVITRPNYIQKFYCNEKLDAQLRDKVRATIIRDRIKGR